jgi:type IV pilus assembly protein PilA
MIVVAIIVVLVAITIPGILRSRLTANEATAIASIKTIAAAAVAFRISNAGYPSNLSQLIGVTPPYLDSVLGSGVKQGYSFTLMNGPGFFNVTAVPIIQNVTGARSFYADASGVVRASTVGNATSASTPL